MGLFWIEIQELRNLLSDSERETTDTVKRGIRSYNRSDYSELQFSGSYQRYSQEQTIKIILEDINDQTPIIETKNLSLSEQLKEVTEYLPCLSFWLYMILLFQGVTINTPIIATDLDDPETDNAKIVFEIIELQDSDGNVVEQLFQIASQDESGVAYLSTIKDLENHYGEYKLIIQVSNNIRH